MYKIEKKPYGAKLTFSGFIQQDEMASWVEESQVFLKNTPREFGVFVDMRNLKTLPPESKALMEKGQTAYRSKGMVRSVVILSSAIVQMQFKRIAQQSGIYKWERYIDASSIPNWQSLGEAWVVDAVDPDL